MSIVSFTDSFFSEANDSTRTASHIVGEINFDGTNIFQDGISNSECSRVFDVRQFLPYWLVQDHENNKTLLVTFLQHYYDWLYCSDLSNLYTDNIRTLQDLENITDTTKDAFIKSFIPQIYEEVQNHTSSEITNFLLNLKRDVISKKGTEESIALFFTKLFPKISSVTFNTVSNLELNITINTTEISEIDTYVSAYEKYMHIAGTRVSIGSNLDAGSESTEQDEDDEILERLAGTPRGATLAQLFDFTTIGNYIVYSMGGQSSTSMWMFFCRTTPQRNNSKHRRRSYV